MIYINPEATDSSAPFPVGLVLLSILGMAGVSQKVVAIAIMPPNIKIVIAIIVIAITLIQEVLRTWLPG